MMWVTLAGKSNTLLRVCIKLILINENQPLWKVCEADILSISPSSELRDNPDQSVLIIKDERISIYQKSNCNKPFCSHIKLLLNLTSELFSIKYLTESFIQMRSTSKLVLFHTKILLFVRANQKL